VSVAFLPLTVKMHVGPKGASVSLTFVPKIAVALRTGTNLHGLVEAVALEVGSPDPFAAVPAGPRGWRVDAIADPEQVVKIAIVNSTATRVAVICGSVMIQSSRAM